eukprot:scaffold90929_cov30-Tisochrysis_lutea.AAC.8
MAALAWCVAPYAQHPHRPQPPARVRLGAWNMLLHQTLRCAYRNLSSRPSQRGTALEVAISE